MIKIITMPYAAVSKSQDITITLKISESLCPTDVKLLFCKKNEWLKTINIDLYEIFKQDGYIFFSNTFKFENVESESDYVHYCCFEFRSYGNQKWIKRKGVERDPQITDDGSGYHWDITVHNDFNTPEWAKGGIMYQLFVDRFRKGKNTHNANIEGRIYHDAWNEEPKWSQDSDGNYRCDDFYGGNIAGIEEKLNYLHLLGVTILYLTPIMKSQSNHRYDTIDYDEIDPDVGDWEDLKRLCAKAKKYNISIILDMVFSHTGDKAVYLEKGFDWYEKGYNGNYCYWWGFKNLVVLNKNNQEYQRKIFGPSGIIEKCLNAGVRGFRLDVADDLTDYFIQGIKDAMNRMEVVLDDTFILYGEVWQNAIKKTKGDEQRKYLLGDKLDSVMNYPIMDAMLRYIRYGKAGYFQRVVDEIYKDYPTDALDTLMNIVDTHDTARVLNILSGEYMKEDEFRYEFIWNMEDSSPWSKPHWFDTQGFRQWQHDNELSSEQYREGIKLLKLLILIQFFIKGIPCIFYGDEIGLNGYKDPFNRKSFPWKGKQDNSLLDFYKKVAKIRHKNKDILATGDFKFIIIKHDLLIFERYNEKGKLIIAINRSYTEKNIDLDGTIIFNSSTSTAKTLKPFSGIVIRTT